MRSSTWSLAPPCPSPRRRRTNLARRRRATIFPWCAGLLLLLLIAGPARAEQRDGGDDEEEAAAKQSENPISNTIHLIAENGTSYDIGPHDRTLNVLTLQPILPIGLGQDVTLIAIARVPLVWQPDLPNPTGVTFGLGDISANLFFGPKSRSIFFWGIGPALRLPNATSSDLGAFDSDQLSLGPAASWVAAPGHWVLGFTVNNVWSVAGREGAGDVNSFLLQPLLNYNLPRGWYLTSSPFVLCDWTAADGNECLVPVGAGIGKVTLLSSNVALGFEAHAYWNAVRPDFGPSWNMRLQASLSFPKRR